MYAAGMIFFRYVEKRCFYLLTLIFVDYCGIFSLRQCVATINSFMFILSE